jgi:cbb3-type cytochrome oxidase subunit 3
MKTFIIVWLIVMWLVLIAGWVWSYLDKRNEKRKKAPMILIAIGSFMMVVLFLILLRILRK